jgi:hypothetical protein
MSKRFLIVLMIGAAFLVSCAVETRVSDLMDMLPGPADADAWVRKGEPQVFAGQELFTYVDGGADIYLEYGFRKVLVQDYESRAGKTISAEIFEMADPGAAFGMYAFKKGGKGRELGSEGRGQLEDYYLNFWKGRYLVTLTGFDSDGETLVGLETLARAAEARIEGAGRRPRFLDTLPVRDMIKPSLSYFRGPLGLNAVYTRISSEVLGFKEGAAADYDTGISLIVLRYPNGRTSRAAFERLRAALSDPARFFEFQDLADDLAAASDGKGASLYTMPRGDRLWIVRGGSPKMIRSLLAGLRNTR